MRFSIRIHNSGDRYQACFKDVARATANALTQLGHEVVDSNRHDFGRFIIFGATNACDWLPGDAIIYNAEQVSANGRNLMQMLPSYRSHVVWDYAQTNVDWLKENGVDRAVLCPIGYMPSMEMVVHVPPSIDVLFYGSMNERRWEMWTAVDQSGLQTRRLEGVYGRARSECIAKSKVVLNWHFYERRVEETTGIIRGPVFEIFRCSYLWANKKAVVSEGGGIDPELEALAERACVLTTREEVVETCRSLCASDGLRQQVEQRGYEAFKQLNFVENVRKALEQSVV